MATKKLLELAESTSPGDSDILMIEDTVATKRITFLNLFNKVKAKLALATVATSGKASDLSGLATVATSGKLADTTKDANNRTITDAERAKWNGYGTDITSLNSNIASLSESYGALEEKNRDKIIIGSYKDAMLVVSTPTVAFTNGSATFGLASIATTYKKSIVGISAQLRSASSVVITSANFNADNAADLKCVKVSDGTGYTGSIPVTIMIFLAG